MVTLRMITQAAGVEEGLESGGRVTHLGGCCISSGKT